MMVPSSPFAPPRQPFYQYPDWGKDPMTEGKRRIAILGSTGSVGCNTVELVAAQPDAYAVEALVAQRSVERLAAQARQRRAR